MPNSVVPTLPASVPSSSGKASVVIDRFPDGHRLALNRVDTATLTSVVSDHVRDHAVSGELRSENLHYFDLSLSGRPKGAWKVRCETRHKCNSTKPRHANWAVAGS